MPWKPLNLSHLCVPIARFIAFRCRANALVCILTGGSLVAGGRAVICMRGPVSIEDLAPNHILIKLDGHVVPKLRFEVNLSISEVVRPDSISFLSSIVPDEYT